MLDVMALANSKLGASFGQGLGAGLGSIGEALKGGPAVSGGGTMDARSFMDGSGWTVSTGASKATGGDREQGAAFEPYSPAIQSQAPIQAGIGGGGLLAVLVLGLLVWRARQ